MDAAQILITTVIIAIVQLINFVKAKAWDSVVTIIAAGVVGGIVGLTHYAGVTVPSGILIGLGAVGVVTVGQAIGGSK